MQASTLLTAAVTVLLVLGGVLQPAYAVLDTSHIDADQSTGAVIDGTIGAGEYNGYTYRGGGSGFGGPLGNGSLNFESDATNLYIAANIAGNLGNNLITLYLDTKSGGFSEDASMDDAGDSGRNVVSNLTRDSADNFPISADFALQFGNGFTNLFELQPSGSTHTFIAPTTSGTGGSGSAGDREVSLSLSALGLSPGDTVSFFATLISNTNFASDEGIPAPGFSGNPGFGSIGGTTNWGNHSAFVVSVPEPTAFLFGCLVCVASGLRRRVR